MDGAIFLSASVPDPRRAPHYAATADTVAITAAVSALVYVTLGRRPLIWGGHPAITPMIWIVAQDLGLEYGQWVKLYQSRFFEDEFPEENALFGNVIFTDPVAQDREQSLRAMRERMFRDNRFDAAVFIGGMEGIRDEFALFRSFQPGVQMVPVGSTGGAAAELIDRGEAAQDLWSELDYVSLFHRHLGISIRERRYKSPDEQPSEIEDRYWRSGA
ncbi:MAG: hypothetical protein ACJ8FS_16180 [Sphingomicrobium sp.]